MCVCFRFNNSFSGTTSAFQTTCTYIKDIYGHDCINILRINTSIKLSLPSFFKYFFVYSMLGIVLVAAFIRNRSKGCQ